MLGCRAGKIDILYIIVPKRNCGKTTCGLILFSAGLTLAAEPTVVPYLEVNGRPAATSQVRLKTAVTEINASFTAAQDGTYRFGVSISSPEIAPLAPGMPRYTCDSLHQPLTLRYPYDWTWRNPKGNVLNSQPRLIMPGVQAGDRLYIVDTHELFLLTLEPCASDHTLHAQLLAYRFFNDGGDRSTPDLNLRRGDTTTLTVRIYPDLRAANLARFSKHEPMKGFATQPPYREWATQPLPQAGYEKIGSKLQGVYQYVITREVVDLPWIPQILHRYGLKAISYQYLGALRRFTSQLTPEIQKQVEMRDRNGQLYTAPRSPNGNWLLGDIRRPEVRARLVANARAAIRAGFDGVFLDGYPFWADATGDIGGNVPGATHSLAYARSLLLHEMKQSMREENPRARLGLLANQYFDSLGEADWAAKERMYFSWDNDAERKGTRIRKDLDRGYERNDAPYAAGPLMYGCRGFDPVAVQSAIHFLEHPTGLIYTDASDFPEAKLDEWLDIVRADIAQTDLYISDIEPASCWIEFPGIGTVRSDSNCKVKFSRPICLSEQPSGQTRRGVQEFATKANVLYRVARECNSEK